MNPVSTDPNEIRAGRAADAGRRALARMLTPQQIACALGCSERHGHSLLSGDRTLQLEQFLRGVIEVQHRKGTVQATLVVSESLHEIGFRLPVESVPAYDEDHSLLEKQLDLSVRFGELARALRDAIEDGCTDAELARLIQANAGLMIVANQIVMEAQMNVVPFEGRYVH